jgi:lysine-N-methylase
MQHYDCTGCGDCCRGRFAIIITQADRDRIEKQGWSDSELGLEGKPLFVPRGSDFQLAHDSTGACVFLGDDNLCRIHGKYGEAAKPLACRMYPFRLIPLGSQVRVDVRFDCPATSGNLGRAIPAHKADLTVLLKSVAPEGVSDAVVPKFNATTTLPWAQLARVMEAFDRVLLDVSIDITRRIAGCVNLNAILRQMRLTGIGDADLDELLDTLTADVQAAAAADPLKRKPLLGIEGSMFRHLLDIYCRIDEVGKRSSQSSRLATSLRMLSGQGSVPALRDGFPITTFKAIDALSSIPTGDAALAVERYLHVHLTSMGYFGRGFYGRSFTDGLNSLLLTYPLISWVARAIAIGEGLATIDKQCTERAMAIIDHQHGVTPMLNTSSSKFVTNMLTDRRVLRALVIWYGS